MKSWSRSSDEGCLDHETTWHPCGFNPRHAVLDRAILASCDHRLKDDQQRPAILGVEHVLLLGEPLGTAMEELNRVGLVHLQTARIDRIEVLQLKALAFGDAERMDVLLDPVQDLLSLPWRNLPLAESLAPESQGDQNIRGHVASDCGCVGFPRSTKTPLATKPGHPRSRSER